MNRSQPGHVVYPFCRRYSRWIWPSWNRWISCSIIISNFGQRPRQRTEFFTNLIKLRLSRYIYKSFYFWRFSMFKHHHFLCYNFSLSHFNVVTCSCSCSSSSVLLWISNNFVKILNVFFAVWFLNVQTICKILPCICIFHSILKVTFSDEKYICYSWVSHTVDKSFGLIYALIIAKVIIVSNSDL